MLSILFCTAHLGTALLFPWNHRLLSAQKLFLVISFPIVEYNLYEAFSLKVLWLFKVQLLLLMPYFLLIPYFFKKMICKTNWGEINSTGREIGNSRTKLLLSKDYTKFFWIIPTTLMSNPKVLIPVHTSE